MQTIHDNRLRKNDIIYIKIMHDDTIDSGYYYLIRVIGRDGKVISGMINPISGELMAVTSSIL